MDIPTSWLVPPASGWSLEARKSLGVTWLKVDMPVWSRQTDGLRLRVYSSMIEARALIPEEWEPGVADTVNARSENGGGKGRVLTLGLHRPGVGRTPVAVLAWHLPPEGPLEILELDVARSLRTAQPRMVRQCGETLLHVLGSAAASAAIGRSDTTLAWVTDRKDTAIRAYSEWEFKGLKKEAHPEHNTAKHYLRRTTS